ncbi:MAG: hypothetical protein R6U65_00395 [Perlabentimonas sp.]
MRKIKVIYNLIFMKKRASVPCPKCNKTDMVVPIIYGYPNQILLQKSKKGIVKLGGCLSNSKNPLWYCKRDDVRFR